VRISSSNAGYTKFRGNVKITGYPLHSPVSPSLPLPASTCAITFQLQSTAHQEGIRKGRGIVPPIFSLTVVVVSFTSQLLFSPRCTLSRKLNDLQGRSRNFGERAIPCHFQDSNHDSPGTQPVVCTLPKSTLNPMKSRNYAVPHYAVPSPTTYYVLGPNLSRKPLLSTRT
jgi:hypothetical protein